LNSGAVFPLVKRPLSLNDISSPGDPLAEVTIMAKNDPDTGLRAMRSVAHHQLPITRAIPITRASGKKRVVLARFVHNNRLVDALGAQAFSALTASPGAHAYYDAQRSRGVGHYAALRQLANRLVGVLHGCLKTRTPYDETTAWSHHLNQAAA
jgi:hypothetical protein